ncbi:MAG: penicillin-binding protein 1C [Campylobacterales bacterium]|nr:penicillin-binding protein 1C [Campylobacterales bacterium]
MRYQKLLIVVVSTVVLFVMLHLLFPLDIDKLHKPRSTIICDREGRIAHIHLSSDGFVRMEMDSIPDDVKRVLLSYEDRYFYYHFGINPLSIIRAVWFNLRNERRIGASTLSMQLARMMSDNERTLASKLSEAFRAMQIEWRYSKEEILRLYLNNAPFGGNVEGFYSASTLYFGREPEALSLAQIAYLLSIPKNPNANRPKHFGSEALASQSDTKVSPPRVEYLKTRVLSTLPKTPKVTRAMHEELKPFRRALPDALPHLSQYIQNGKKVKTTIKHDVQRMVEEYLRDEVDRLKPLNIHNAAALVIDNKTMEILAYVGSNDFKSHYEGQIDGVRATISAGSTLKPFIYALALEQGIITPLKNMYDISLSIWGYAPQNYSKRFVGVMSASEALQYSINTVAVELDRILGDHSLYELLKKAQLASIDKSKHYYGSAIVLGGSGITLLELAQLYAALANGGKYQKAKYIKESNSSMPIEILSPQSSYLISEILANVPRERFGESWEYIKGLNRIAFKTGTSAHAKDLLTIGYTPNYTVAVWFGNFNRKIKVDELQKPTGIRIASPTMLKIFKILNDNSWFSKPSSITTQKICQDAIVVGACKNFIEDSVIQGVKLYSPCKLLRAEVLAKMMESGVIDSMEELKHHECYEEWSRYKPLIASPIPNGRYIHHKALPQELKKMKFECYSFETNTTIYWLINNRPPIQSSSKSALFEYLGEGRHTVRCLDQGSKMQTIEVWMEEM